MREVPRCTDWDLGMIAGQSHLNNRNLAVSTSYRTSHQDLKPCLRIVRNANNVCEILLYHKKMSTQEVCATQSRGQWELLIQLYFDSLMCILLNYLQHACCAWLVRGYQKKGISTCRENSVVALLRQIMWFISLIQGINFILMFLSNYIRSRWNCALKWRKHFFGWQNSKLTYFQKFLK